jgi:hypothetical protein
MGTRKRRSRSLRDDSQKSKGKGRSRLPEGMTERKAKAAEKAKASGYGIIGWSGLEDQADALVVGVPEVGDFAEGGGF